MTALSWNNTSAPPCDPNTVVPKVWGGPQGVLSYCKKNEFHVKVHVKVFIDNCTVNVMHERHIYMYLERRSGMK